MAAAQEVRESPAKGLQPQQTALMEGAERGGTAVTGGLCGEPMLGTS